MYPPASVQRQANHDATVVSKTLGNVFIPKVFTFFFLLFRPLSAFISSILCPFCVGLRCRVSDLYFTSRS